MSHSNPPASKRETHHRRFTASVFEPYPSTSSIQPSPTSSNSAGSRPEPTSDNQGAFLSSSSSITWKHDGTDPGTVPGPSPSVFDSSSSAKPANTIISTIQSYPFMFALVGVCLGVLIMGIALWIRRSRPKDTFNDETGTHASSETTSFDGVHSDINPFRSGSKKDPPAIMHIHQQYLSPMDFHHHNPLSIQLHHKRASY